MAAASTGRKAPAISATVEVSPVSGDIRTDDLPVIRSPARSCPQASDRDTLTFRDTVSVISRVVNDPGEARETDIGLTGGGNGTH